MSLRRATKVHKGKTCTNYPLVASVHTAKGPRPEQKRLTGEKDRDKIPREVMKLVKTWHKLSA